MALTTDDEKQAAYVTQRRIRQGYLDNSVRDRFMAQSPAPGQTYMCSVAWCAPMQMRAVGHWSSIDPACPKDDVGFNVMRYRLDSAGPCWFVTCEGYLVDKWWKEDHRDISNLGR